jgi:hypothetical protein
MQTALKQLIEQLRLSGNIHGVIEAEKFLPIEKEMIKNAYWNGTVDLSKNDALEFAEEFFNDYYN